MAAADYFMLGFVLFAYAIGPLITYVVLRRFEKSGLFDKSDL